MTQQSDPWGAGRVLNVLLGSWLFASGFLWDHAPAQRLNTWTVGVLCVMLAVIAATLPAARRGTSALALWLLASVWLLPHGSLATEWNNATAAVAMFLASLVPTPGEGTPVEERAPI